MDRGKSEKKKMCSTLSSRLKGNNNKKLPSSTEKQTNKYDSMNIIIIIIKKIIYLKSCYKITYILNENNMEMPIIYGFNRVNETNCINQKIIKI
jgi:hypothetical protein